MIQEVVGTRVGRYFLPAFSGVAFSNNEFRWSPRIRREDGLLRIVPGLGTRAVDRLVGRLPGPARAGTAGPARQRDADESCRYSPRKIDVINLETRRFETVEIARAARRVRPRPAGDRPDAVGVRPGRHAPRRSASTGNPTASRPSSPSTAWFANAVPRAHARAAAAAAREDRQAGGHRVRLGRPAPVPAAVPRPELRRRCRAGADSARPAAGAHRLHRQPLRLERPRAGHHAHRLRRSGPVQALGEPGGPARRRPRRRPPERAAAEAAVHPHGPGPLGQPRRHQARRQRHATPTSTTRPCSSRSRASAAATCPTCRSARTSSRTSSSRASATCRSTRTIPASCSTRLPARRTNLLPEMLPELAHLADVVHVIDVAQATGGLVLQVLMNADSEEAIGLFAPPAARSG